MKIEVTQCSMCKHYSEEQYCEIWQQYIANDAFYCACGVKADRKTENSSEKPNNCEPQMDCVKCKSFQYNGWYCTAKTNGYPCKFEPKDEPQTERSSE